MTTVYVGGTFDLLHLGHIELLQGAYRLAGMTPWFPGPKVVVALNTDEFIEEYKGKKPICSYEERLGVLEAIKYVHEVIPNIGGTDSKPSILSVKPYNYRATASGKADYYSVPYYVCAGSDWTRERLMTQMSLTEDWLETNNIKIEIIPRTTGVSSSQIKSRI